MNLNEYMKLSGKPLSELTPSEMDRLATNPVDWEIYQQERQKIHQKEQADEQDRQHKQQCRTIALDKAHKGREGYDSSVILKEADKIYEWLVK